MELGYIAGGMSAAVEMCPGQRWTSVTEPELGLGIVLEIETRAVRILFPAGGEARQYARDTPALRRVSFRVGDRVRGQEETTFVVQEVAERDGLLVYRGEGHELAENALHDTTSFSTPRDRLLHGHVDDSVVFELRHDTLETRRRLLSSRVHGLMGGRIELLSHQVFIASEVTSRRAPRVLLADEVGLGKTVEAGLILHRLLRTGRASRVLILVPEPLVHQWFVEMFRRFNLWFNIFDESRCAAIQEQDGSANPFLDDQLVLCSIDFPSRDAVRAAQVIEAGWDVVVADEAHHLSWDPACAGYGLVEALGRRAPSLLLLTATPEQLGEESHFARLRLLDPDRFTDYASYREEAAHYRELATVVARIESADALADDDVEFLARQLHEPELRKLLDHGRAAAPEAAVREQIVRHLLDRHGPCRVMFRNTRSALEGFPSREVSILAFDPGEDDPRMQWLTGFLKEDPSRKVLVICHEKETAIQLSEEIARRTRVGIGVFHEDLPLVQRDRQAAWFAEEEGAQILICSEIGGEGRNFQFAHDLVLVELPFDPERLEQRIGRLDRIGQKGPVRIHVPFIRGTREEVLARWYREGLHAFTDPLPGGRLFREQFLDRIERISAQWEEDPDAAAIALEVLLSDSRQFREQVARELEEGRDRLLESGSNRPGEATHLIEAIQEEEQGRRVEDFMIRIFDHFGITVDEMSARTFQLIPGDLFTDAFPSIPREGVIVTADRANALSRDDLGYLSWDHPMVTGAFDLLIGSEHGNAAFAVWASEETQDILAEAIYIVEAPASPALHVDRFLAPTPVRIVVSLREGDVTENSPVAPFRRTLKEGHGTRLLEDTDVVRRAMPTLLETAETVAQDRLAEVIVSARDLAQASLAEELDRLNALRRLNDHVRPEEVHLLEREIVEVDEALSAARLRLDAVRLVWKGPVDG